mmetsp:Transcript_94636/g.273628  ORF Transcript_94636/g.273628 Transcript_94636/m.273628 type:complete len:445 (-) Transcript_94636:62-1396(-)|eukprot:CAMPEP_0176072652 /NCGR_PEP_ID=MMETSP0120_2-20121206/36297_1 /TAXON_ID=160619 /ORGANISM="Kryptoperidinium foliaceum, Strain CCMP 1326" /LENGTH=444 /DNA_ID=CAMNT_0017406327 /DNA_START=53 /DNA_END=1387 /DNA_ORIENTATION=-
MALVLAGSGTSTALAKREPDEVQTEDGRLLRMFVSRGVHKQADAKECATKDWLIRESFYEEWLDTFVERYGQKDVVALSTEAAQKRYQEIQESCEAILRADKKHVEELEKSIQEAAGDVHKLRDALLAAVKSLQTPKRRLGLPSGTQLTEEEIQKMKQMRQARLRDVVFNCLQGIWLSGCGGEVLQVAMQHVQKLIFKFEDKADDVRDAFSGDSWQKLKSLVNEIEGELPETVKRHVEIEGKGTKLLVQQALEDLGGKASTQEIFQWVEEHADVVGANSHIKINQKISAKKDTEIWRNTIRNVLTINFQKSARKRDDGCYVWFPKGAQDELLTPLALANRAASSPPPVADGEASPPAEEAVVPAEVVAAPPAKRRRAAADGQAQQRKSSAAAGKKAAAKAAAAAAGTPVAGGAEGSARSSSAPRAAAEARVDPLGKELAAAMAA